MFCCFGFDGDGLLFIAYEVVCLDLVFVCCILMWTLGNKCLFVRFGFYFSRFWFVIWFEGVCLACCFDLSMFLGLLMCCCYGIITIGLTLCICLFGVLILDYLSLLLLVVVFIVLIVLFVLVVCLCFKFVSLGCLLLFVSVLYLAGVRLCGRFGCYLFWIVCCYRFWIILLVLWILLVY